MKVIDFKLVGNVMRLYLGTDDCNDYLGDDWDDTPYEHNAGMVYEEYISQYVDYAFPIDYLVLEPQNDWKWHGNSPYNKDNMKDGNVPCLVIVSPEVKEDSWEEGFGYWASSKNVTKIFFNDDYKELDYMLRQNGAIQLFTPKTYIVIRWVDELPKPSEHTMWAEYRICKTGDRYITLFDKAKKENQYSWERKSK